MKEQEIEQEIDLRDFIKVISKRRQIVYTFFLVIFVLVLIGTFTATPLYEAKTQLLVERSASNPLDPQQRYYSKNFAFLETQRHIIKSFSVAKKVVENLSLDMKYGPYFLDEGGFLSRLSGSFNLKWFFPTANESEIEDTDLKSKADVIAMTLSEELEVKPIRNSNIINISYLSKNPVLAKMIVNTVANAYIEEILEIKMHSTGYAIKWMTEKAAEERTKLERAERALQKYTKENDIVTVENRIAIIPKKLEEFSTLLSQAETRNKELEALYLKTKEVKGDLSVAETIPGISSNQSLQTLREQILKTEQNIIELSKKYGRKHPVMIRAKDELAVYMDKREKEIIRLVDSIRNEYELAEVNEDNLRRLLMKTKEEALNLNERFIQYSILKREVESNRVLFVALVRETKEQAVTEQTQNVKVWVVTEAQTPESAAKPRKALNLALGLLVGLFGGVGLAFFVEYLDNTISSPDEAENRLEVTVLGMVELYREKGEDIEKVLNNKPMCSFAESYKTIRSAVMLSAADKPPRTILVSSTSPDEGKTTTASNLAMAIAQSEKKVLLIDADLRRSSLHKMYRVANTVGLSTFLAGTSEDDEIIHDTDVKNMSIIPAGPHPPNPSELLGSKRLKELLQLRTEEYDFIIIDSAPLLSAADSLVLSKVVDGTIVVARAGKTTYDALGHAMKTLGDFGSHILGIVINGIDMKKTNYGKYHGYYNYYSSEADS